MFLLLMIKILNETNKQVKKICKFCNSTTNIETIYPFSIYNQCQTYFIIICSKCNVGITSPQPTFEDLLKIYSDSYSYDSHELIYKEKKLKTSQIIKLIRNKDSMLEIGCSHGLLIKACHSEGFEKVIGVELNPTLRCNLNSEGYKIYSSLTEINLEKPFSTVVMNHSLEHILNLEDLASDLNRHLRNDGQLIILLPNFNSIWRKLFKRSWGWYQQPVHIWHLSADVLSEFFSKYGFDVENIIYAPGDSLLPLITINNLIQRKLKHSSNTKISNIQIQIIKIFSIIWRSGLNFFSKDELIIVFRKIKSL